MGTLATFADVAATVLVSWPTQRFPLRPPCLVSVLVAAASGGVVERHPAATERNRRYQRRMPRGKVWPDGRLLSRDGQHAEPRRLGRSPFRVLGGGGDRYDHHAMFERGNRTCRTAGSSAQRARLDRIPLGTRGIGFHGSEEADRRRGPSLARKRVFESACLGRGCQHASRAMRGVFLARPLRTGARQKRCPRHVFLVRCSAHLRYRRAVEGCVGCASGAKSTERTRSSRSAFGAGTGR